MRGAASDQSSLPSDALKPLARRARVTASIVPVSLAASAASVAADSGMRTTEMSRNCGPHEVPMSKRMARP